MKRVTVLVLLLVGIGFVGAHAQSTIQKPAPSKVFFGGNLGFNVSNDFWMINLSPLVGYQLTPPLSGGVGLIYQYESNSRPYRSEVHSYGGSVFLRYDLSANLMKDMPFGIFFQSDYEGTENRLRFRDFPASNANFFVNRLFVGAGYIQPISNRSRVFIMLSVDLLNSGGDRGIQPLIRGGFIF